MYRDLGLSRTDVAQLLRVSERTIHNWETGHHQVPYSAYKLVRLMTHQELPHSSWAGWHITAGTLYSPEGHGFKPQDSSWWSLLCRKAAMFHVLYAKQSNDSTKRPVDATATGARGGAGGGRRPLDLSLGHFRTSLGVRSSIGSFCPSDLRYRLQLTPKTPSGGAV